LAVQIPRSLELDLLTNLSKLGTSINQFLHYFDEFWINKVLSMSYMHCLIGFNIDYDKFMSSVILWLKSTSTCYKSLTLPPLVGSLACTRISLCLCSNNSSMIWSKQGMLPNATQIVQRVLNTPNPLPLHRKFYVCVHRSMTSTDDSTMVASKAASTLFKEVVCT